MFSDIENLDIKLGRNNLEREETNSATLFVGVKFLVATRIGESWCEFSL